MRRLGIAALALAAMPMLVTLWLSSTQQAHGQPDQRMRVVAPAVAHVGEEFSVNFDILEAGSSGYQDYGAHLVWSDNIAYVDPPGVTYTGLGGMTFGEQPVVQPDGVRFGSSGLSGCTTSTGTAARVRLKCVGRGWSALHLVSMDEDPWGTWLACPGVDPGYWPSLLDDSIACLGDTDADGDGCSEYQEAFGAPAPYPGSTCVDGSSSCYSEADPYDFYDVPVPSLRFGPGGTRDRAVGTSDVMAVNSYSSVQAGQAAYEADVNGNTVRDGLEYDRSASSKPNPPYDAGPPDGHIGVSDVLAVNAQVSLSCAGPP